MNEGRITKKPRRTTLLAIQRLTEVLNPPLKVLTEPSRRACPHRRELKAIDCREQKARRRGRRRGKLATTLCRVDRHHDLM